MASDREIGKKELELIQLNYFLEAYKYATGNKFSPFVASFENPDFLVEDKDGRVLGVELTKLMRPPDEQEEPDPYGQLEDIHYIIDKKEKARKERYVKKVADTILVVEVVDGTLSDFIYFLEGLKGDYSDHGFAEIWLSDYSDVDAYSNVELFCIFPEENWGFFERPNAGSKPYG